MNFEYIENNPDSWKFQKLPDIPKEFQAELTKIGGINRFGQPNLRVVRGNEVLSDIAEDASVLKYHVGYSATQTNGFEYEEDGIAKYAQRIEDVPEGLMVKRMVMGREPLGELRYIIEVWVSPEELEAKNRFQNRAVDGEVLLREFPRQGIYERYFTVETADGGFRKLDNAVLEFIAFKWKTEQELSEDQLMEIYDHYEQEKKKQEFDTYQERVKAALAGDLRLPQEEMERREAYWRHHHESGLQ